MTNQSRSDWTANGVPARVIEALFVRMASLYGSRFADLWRGQDLAEVHRVWSIELRQLTPDQLGLGVKTLAQSCLYPPTLPQFVSHCRQARRDAVSNAPALTDDRKADPQEVAANMDRVRDSLKPLEVPRVAGIAWAYRLLERGKSASGGPLPAEVVRVAKAAIFNKTGKHWGNE